MRIAFSLLFCLFLGCSTAPTSQLPLVVVPVPPYTFLVTKIADGTVDILSAVPNNVDPHLYEPTPQDAHRLSQAKLWISLGENFEQPILKFIQSKRNDLTILPLVEKNKDPHVWMNPKMVSVQVDWICDALSQLFPEHEALYRRNTLVLKEQLKSLDLHLHKLLEKTQGDAVIVSHDSFGYFCDAYGLIQISVEVEGKSPRPQTLSKALKEARDNTVRCVLSQPQYNNAGAERLANILDLKVYTVDPLSPHYLDEMRHLGEVIAR